MVIGATRAWLGFDFHAGCVTLPASASTPREPAIRHEPRQCRIDVRRERGRELGAVQLRGPILRRKDRRDRRSGRRIGDQRLHGFASVGDEGGDVGKARDLGIVSGFRDNDSTIGVADKDDGVLRCGDRAPGHDHVVGKRDCRVLDDDDFVAVLAEDAVDPASRNRRRIRRGRGRC